jgi:hypothetical protein
MAYVQMRLILARILWNFDLELVDKNEKWEDQRVYIFWEKSALRLKLTPVVREK